MSRKYYYDFRFLRFIPHSNDCAKKMFYNCKFSKKQKIIGFEELLKYKHNKRIHPLWNLWELDQLEYKSYIEWLPREIIEMNLEYYRGKYQVDATTYIY